MSPYAFDPTVALSSTDAQVPRPSAPRSSSQNSFDDHLQQASQAGSNPSSADPQSSSPITSSQSAAPAGPKSPSAAEPDAQAKARSTHAAAAKSETSQPRSDSNAGAALATRNTVPVSAPTTAKDSASASSSADTKATTTKTETPAATAVVQPDAIKPTSESTSKQDPISGSQPTVDSQATATAARADSPARCGPPRCLPDRFAGSLERQTGAFNKDYGNQCRRQCQCDQLEVRAGNRRQEYAVG